MCHNIGYFFGGAPGILGTFLGYFCVSFILEKFDFFKNKKLYRAFRRQGNGLTLNTPVFQGLLRVNRKAEKDT